MVYMHNNLEVHSCITDRSLFFSDVDECVEGLHSCHAVRELCINEIGKYRCEAIIHNEVNREGSQFRNVPHTAFQPHVEECLEGYGFDLTSRQCLGK